MIIMIYNNNIITILYQVYVIAHHTILSWFTGKVDVGKPFWQEGLGVKL